MNKLKVSTRLALLVGVMSLLLLALGLLGIFALGRSNDALRTVYEDRAVPATQIGEIKSMLLYDRMAIAQALLQPTPEFIAERSARIEANQARIEQLWKAYMASYLTPEEAKLAAELGPDLARVAQEGVRPAVAALRAGDLPAATKLSQQTLRELFVKAEPEVDALLKLQIDVARSEYDAAVGRFQTMRAVSIAAIVAGLLFGVAVGTWLVRSLTAQLGAEPAEAAALARHVAAGNLGVDIALKPGDTASLMAQMKTMRDSLVQVVGEVRQHAEGVATASAQIAQGNGDLSGRTEEQASALQQTAASMEQLGTTVTQNADNARTANQLAQGASAVAGEGGAVVGQLVHTMKEIDAASKRIADIIGTIDGIAFQTNILALNAAVEAARAGEQGRGFAVVASEVRALAGRSAEAAREIKSLIAASVERVEQGSALADKAGATMTEVVGSIRRVSDLVGEISAATGEQSAGVTQVGSAMTQMDQATQQNAALVEESAAAAESLKHQAQQLVRSVAVFSLEPARA